MVALPMECLTCKTLINQRTRTLLPLDELEERLNLRPRSERVLKTVNAGGVPEKKATFWWFNKRNGNRKPYGGIAGGPVSERSLIVIWDYQSGLGTKAIAKKRFNDPSKGAAVHLLLNGLGMIDKKRPSPIWLGKGPSALPHSEHARRNLIKAFEADQFEWRRGVKQYERAVNAPHWRVEHNRMMASPELRIKFYLRKRLRHCAIDKQHSLKSVELFGCTMTELRAHLESKFAPWMSWANYGSKWHIDHEKPCRAFDLTDPEQAKMCFHFTNLRPMEAGENIRKSDKLPNGTRARHA